MKLVPLPKWKEGEIKWRPIAKVAYAETYCMMNMLSRWTM